MRAGKERKLRRQIRILKQAKTDSALSRNIKGLITGADKVYPNIPVQKKPDIVLNNFMSDRVSMADLAAAGYPIKREKV